MNTKDILRKILGKKLSQNLGKTKRNSSNLILLLANSYKDAITFYKHSMVFKLDNFNKIESRIILHYHAIEKGFLHENFRYRFGESRVKELLILLKDKDIVKYNTRSQVAVAYLAMCKYYEKHLDDGVEISDFYSREDYELFRSLTVLNKEIIKIHNHDEYFKNNRSDFLVFSKSRSSVRNFTGETIPFQLIENAIGIAKTAPSVCNRQPCRVYYIESKLKIDRVFAIQQGLVGYSDNIHQLLVLVADKNYYYTVGERNQLYIDGGLFLMNLLYALHYFSIGACPAHWGFNHDKDKQIQHELQLTDSERVICLVPIGIPNESFKTTLSLRRENEEILKIVSS